MPESQDPSCGPRGRPSSRPGGYANSWACASSDVGGTREIFPPESDSARLVPPEDPVALARAMAELLSDSATCQELARRARRRAEEAFDHHRAAAGLLAHYRAVLEA